MPRGHLDDLEEAEALATQSIKQYFASPSDAQTPQDLGSRVDKALILLARANSKRDGRLKELSLAFGIAKAMGLRGEVLRPLLAELRGDASMPADTPPPGAARTPETPEASRP